jgi:DNA-binding NarL/FixJ family response regulator
MAYPGPKPSNDTKSIVVVHHHALIREGIARILQEADFRVVGQADTGRTLLKLVTQHNPDIVLVDWEISEVDPYTIRGVTEKFPSTIIVILTRPQSADAFLPAMQAGARGYLSVNLSAPEFVRALRMLADGDIIISREMVKGVKEEMAAEQALKTGDDISGREREVLQLVSRGATNREIAETLIVSEHTVKVHVRNILNKLNLRNRQQVAAYAVQEGLVPDIKSENENPSEFTP